jgi:hypothetical protein
MRSEKIARRGFLKTAGVALGGSALLALPERAIALGAAENNFAYDVRAFGGLFRGVERFENASPCFEPTCRCSVSTESSTSMIRRRNHALLRAG